MDFRHLEYFVEIAKDNNITRAAERLYVSQSAVNQYLLKLEAELGTHLFVRSRRNWRLTEAGKIYLEGCRKALMIRQDTYRRIADITESRSSTLTVGLTPNRGLIMFTSIYPELHHKFPDLTVTPFELDSKGQQKAVNEGEIDLGFIVDPEYPEDRHSFFDLGTEEMVVAVPADKTSASNGGFRDRLPEIELSSLQDMPFIMTRSDSSASVHRSICDSIFRKAGIVPNILTETVTTAHILPFAQSCKCCGIIPRYYLDPEATSMKYYVLPDHPSWHLYLIHRKDAYLTRAAKEYIRLAKEYWTKHLVPPQA